MNPFQSLDYLKSLDTVGTPFWLNQVEGWLLERPITHSPYTDLVTPYPLGFFQNVTKLQDEIEWLKSSQMHVSLLCVADPLQPLPESIFDIVTPFKTHHIIDFNLAPQRSSHHAYYLKKAQEKLTFSQCQNPLDYIEKWKSLYQNLVLRHDLKGGFHDYTATQFDQLFKLPQTQLFIAFLNDEIVLMHLWLVSQDNKKAYSHLIAASTDAYKTYASYGLHDFALSFYQKRNFNYALLGSGLKKNDGLNKFKSGWANLSLTNSLYCSILNRNVYNKLTEHNKLSKGDFFPAYRSRYA